MNFRYFIHYVGDDYHVVTLYADDERITALRIFQNAKNHLRECESVYLAVRSVSAMMKGKQEIVLSYYRPTVLTHEPLWREVKKM
jgi:hypothetical protein